MGLCKQKTFHIGTEKVLVRAREAEVGWRVAVIGHTDYANVVTPKAGDAIHEVFQKFLFEKRRLFFYLELAQGALKPMFPTEAKEAQVVQVWESEDDGDVPAIIFGRAGEDPDTAIFESDWDEGNGHRVKGWVLEYLKFENNYPHEPDFSYLEVRARGTFASVLLKLVEDLSMRVVETTFAWLDFRVEEMERGEDDIPW